MPTVNDSLIPTDYATLALWEDATDTDLVTADTVERALVEWTEAADEIVVSGTACTMAGATTDATRYLEVTANVGASIADHAGAAANALKYNAGNGAAVRTTDNYSFVLVMNENFARVTKLQLSGRDDALTRRCVSQGDNGGKLIEGCIIRGWLSSRRTTVRNTLIYARSVTVHTTLSLYNCTIIGALSDGTNIANLLDGNYGSGEAKNCALFGCDNVQTGSMSWTFSDCLTDDPTPPTGCTTAIYADQFEDPSSAGPDFRLKSGADCIDAGADLSGDGVTVDIIGTARPQGSAYDVGAWEFEAGGGTVALAGTLAANSGGAAALSVARGLAGAVPASSGMSGALSVVRGLAGTLAASSALAGALAVARGLAGTVAARSAGSAALRVARALRGAIAIVTGLAGSLTIGAGTTLGDVAVSARAGTDIALTARAGTDIALTARARTTITLTARPADG